ncbi:MAG: ATP-binding cassette domain-containing protein, partial [Clostridiales bacterium]|nr:ATP-binding cassette domain-containing protein [Clostridiales bacterium]
TGVGRKITPDTGLCRFGANVHLGYFDQIQSGLSSSKTVLEELYDTFPAYTISELRGLLGAFKFGGEDINKVMCDLSGGERARIALLELMLKKPNLLILDEPTNHLDIASREVLEDALLDYDGTILCVSHDRFLVNKLATRILILKDGSLTSFDGTYEDYAAAAAMPVKTAQKQEKKPNEYLLRKERESEERKRKTRIKRLEAEIEETELLKTETENELQKSDVISDYKKLSELTEKLNKLAEKQDRLYEEWMQING